MDPVDQYPYYRLGAALKEFNRLPEGVRKLSDVFIALYEADQALEDFDRAISSAAKDAARDVRSEIANLNRQAQGTDRRPNFAKEFQPFEFYDLNKAVGDFQTILARECPKLPIFYVPQKGISRTDDLITRADAIFPEPIRAKLPSNAIEELRQAGKALAFDLYTAYAFHMMRATEITMRVLLGFYYDQPLAPSRRGIGAYVQILKNSGVDPELGRFLDDLVRVERNEGIHPEKLLTEVDAELLASTAKSAIIAMVRDMENRDAYLALAEAAKVFQQQEKSPAVAAAS